MKKFEITKVREMTKNTIQTEIGAHAKELEKLGMSHEESCLFVSNVMNFGIVMQEIHNEEKTKNK